MTSYENPVVRGNAPDPTAIRVGDDYYLATSSFGWLPGVAIRHSTDLVHWRIIGFAITRPAQYRRDGLPGAIHLFACTLRHYDGVFYLTTTNVADGQGNLLVTATDPAGEWSDAVWLDREGFDPDVFRDRDGIWYYQRRTLSFGPDHELGPIVQAELDPTTGELGDFHPLTPGPHGFVTNDIEGPHLFEKDGWYYLSCAEGSSWTGHMQTIARSRSPRGPFEPAPTGEFLTQRNRVAHPVQTLGHADLVDDANGGWWALSLGTRPPRFAQHHNLGRETFLTPIEWRDGWPHAGVRGGTELRFTDRTLPTGAGTAHRVEETLWTRGWVTLGAPVAGLDDSQSDASILLPAGPEIGAPGAAALLRPQTEDLQRFAATVIADDGVDAGIAVWADVDHGYRVLISTDGSERVAVLRKIVDDLIVETCTPLPNGAVRLAVTCDESWYSFTATVGDERLDLGRGTARLLSAEAAEWFVGVHYALVALGGSGAATFTDVIVEVPKDHGHVYRTLPV